MLMSFGNSAIQINGKNGCLVEDNYIENLYTWIVWIHMSIDNRQ